MTGESAHVNLPRPEVVGIMGWTQHDGLSDMVAEALLSLGVGSVERFLSGRPLPPGVEQVWTIGPLGSMQPLAHQLLAMPRGRRPHLVYWMTEQFPNPALPDLLLRLLGELRAGGDRQTYRLSSRWGWPSATRLESMSRRAARFRYYGELAWLQRHGLVTQLVVGSQWIAGFLRGHGFDPLVAYLAGHPSWGRDLRLDRDVPVLWLGQPGGGRRVRVLDMLQRELRDQGIAMLRVDGVHRPYVFGEERTHLLNRSQIVLNLLRKPWDNHGLRFYLAAINRALVLTEPVYPHTPFRPGEHMLQAPPEQLAAAIVQVLDRHQERREIVERAYRLVTGEMALEKGVASVLDSVSRKVP